MKRRREGGGSIYRYDNVCVRACVMSDQEGNGRGDLGWKRDKVSLVHANAARLRVR